MYITEKVVLRLFLLCHSLYSNKLKPLYLMRISFQQREGFLFEILGGCNIILNLEHIDAFKYNIYKQNTVGPTAGKIVGEIPT